MSPPSGPSAPSSVVTVPVSDSTGVGLSPSSAWAEPTPRRRNPPTAKPVTTDRLIQGFVVIDIPQASGVAGDAQVQSV